MYCYKCGQPIPKNQSNCPICDTPTRKKQIARRRLLLGLVIFLAGALVGSFVDNMFFKYSKNLNKLNLNSTSSINGKINITNTNRLDNLSSSTDQLSPTINYNLAPSSSDSLSIENTSSRTLDQSLQKDIQTSDTITLITNISTNTTSKFDLASETSNFVIKQKKYKLLLEKIEMIEKEGLISFHPSVSVGKKLIFSSNRQNKISSSGINNLLQCFIKDMANLRTKAHLAFSWQGNVWTPELLNNDPTKIIFSSDIIKPEHIFIYDIQTNKYMQITKGNSKYMMPSVSPDGKMVVYVSNKKGNNDIWLMNLSGLNDESEIQLTSNPEDEREPRWFPDCKAIVYTKIVQKLKESYIMKLNLEPIETPQVLIKTKARNWMADVSPCGNYLAYVRSTNSDGSGNIILIKNLNSDEEFQIKGSNISEYYYPRWLPDSSGIVFHGESGKQKNIYLASFKKVELE